MEKKVYQDIDGKESSKRKTGIKIVYVALFMSLTHFIVGIGMSLFGKEFTYSFPFDMWLSLLGIGASLLGITVLERFPKASTTTLK